MKTCCKCKKEIQDDMLFCPYCGAKQEKDVKSELNEAMSELFGESPQEKTMSNIQAEMPIEDKTNQNISRILMIVIGSIIVIIISSLLAMGVSYRSHKNDDPQGELPPVVDKDDSVISEDDENDDVEKDDDETIDEVNDPEEIDFTAQSAEGVSVSKLTAVKENGKIRITVFYQSPGKIKVSMADNTGSVMIDSFEMEKGNSFYLLLSQVNKESYTITIVDQDTQAKCTVTVTGQEILDELN